jgi:serine/threonine protein kinase
MGDGHAIPNYELKNVLGHGSFATVYFGIDKVLVKADQWWYLSFISVTVK